MALGKPSLMRCLAIVLMVRRCIAAAIRNPWPLSSRNARCKSHASAAWWLSGAG